MKNFLRWLGCGIFFLTVEVMAQPEETKIRAGKVGWKKDYPLEQMRQKRERLQRKKMERLTKELNLTKKQQKRISAIFKDGKLRIESERIIFRENLQQIRKDGDEQIKKVLTAEQLKKWKKLKKKIREKTKKRKEKRKERQDNRKKR